MSDVPHETKPLLIFPEPEPEPEAKSVEVLTKESLADYQEMVLVRNAKSLLPKLVKNLKNRLDEGDRWAAEQTMALYGYTKSGQGVVINNIMNQANIRTDRESDAYLESIIAKMEEADREGSRKNEKVVDI